MGEYEIKDNGKGGYTVTHKSVLDYCCMIQIYDAFYMALFIVSVAGKHFAWDYWQHFFMGVIAFIVSMALFNFKYTAIILNVLSCLVWGVSIYVVLFLEQGPFGEWNLIWKIGGGVAVAILIIGAHLIYYGRNGVPWAEKDEIRAQKKELRRLRKDQHNPNQIDALENEERKKIWNSMNECDKSIGELREDITVLLEELEQNPLAQRDTLYIQTRNKIVNAHEDYIKFANGEIPLTQNNLQKMREHKDGLEKLRESLLQIKNKYASAAEHGDNVQFFQNCTSKEELRVRYKKLCGVYHPDNMGGDNDMFLKIKQEYDSICKRNNW